MQTSTFLTVCVDGSALGEALAPFLLTPFVLNLMVFVFHTLVPDLTSLVVSFVALFYAWVVFSLWAVVLRVDRPNADTCDSSLLLGNYAFPDPAGCSLTLYTVLWLLLWLYHGRRRFWRGVASLVLVAILFWVAVGVNRYASVWVILGNVALSSACASGFFVFLRGALLRAVIGWNSRRHFMGVRDFFFDSGHDAYV